ncbi:hypothetical protein [Mucilaginibacter ginkgonis]|uniref:Uncharacterized protein n=1 Tax=Mucilaginibacter ginkgonis TaxID=2682091 RepID=A0A6I4HV44_9SPHI|nr:hypothetical protein [Mucilaginibacter ginkgonis]QQL49943.1 hypothetical protein GO620_000390 [Mucilaginibacter ginkgonis]
MATDDPFEVYYGTRFVHVTKLAVEGNPVYHVDLGRDKGHLLLTVSGLDYDNKQWTSIPQGRQREAAEIGKLIEAYAKRRN